MARKPEEILSQLEEEFAKREATLREYEAEEGERQRAVELAKLNAAALSTLATNLVAVGIFAPIAGIIFTQNRADIGWDSFLAVTVSCLSVAGFIYYEGQEALRKGFSL